MPISALAESHWAADVIYTPIETEFLKAAAAKGACVLNGGGMCVHQAVEAFQLLTGIGPNVARMHRAFATALAGLDHFVLDVEVRVPPRGDEFAVAELSRESGIGRLDHLVGIDAAGSRSNRRTFWC